MTATRAPIPDDPPYDAAADAQAGYSLWLRYQRRVLELRQAGLSDADARERARTEAGDV